MGLLRSSSKVLWPPHVFSGLTRSKSQQHLISQRSLCCGPCIPALASPLITLRPHQSAPVHRPAEMVPASAPLPAISSLSLQPSWPPSFKASVLILKARLALTSQGSILCPVILTAFRTHTTVELGRSPLMLFVSNCHVKRMRKRFAEAALGTAPGT